MQPLYSLQVPPPAPPMPPPPAQCKLAKCLLNTDTDGESPTGNTVDVAKTQGNRTTVDVHQVSF